jgi:hypothetical protein
LLYNPRKMAYFNHYRKTVIGGALSVTVHPNHYWIDS